jgi:hypothetical protein
MYFVMRDGDLESVWISDHFLLSDFSLYFCQAERSRSPTKSNIIDRNWVKQVHFDSMWQITSNSCRKAASSIFRQFFRICLNLSIHDFKLRKCWKLGVRSRLSDCITQAGKNPIWSSTITILAPRHVALRPVCKLKLIIFKDSRSFKIRTLCRSARIGCSKTRIPEVFS